MVTRTYTVGQLKKYIKESASEFSPRLGDDVTSDNKKNNKEAIDKISKETEDYNGGITNNPEIVEIGDNMDYNKTTLDSDYDSEPSDQYKERVKAQVNGFPSKENEEMHSGDDDDTIDNDGNKSIYNSIEKRNKKVNKRREEIKRAGLKSREMPSSQFNINTIFKEGEGEKIKVYTFKNYSFLSESSMEEKIPDKCKVNGNKFIMRDRDGEKYLVKWIVDEKYNVAKPVVLLHENIAKLNDEFNKIKELINYNSSDYFNGTNAKSRVDEEKIFKDLINKR